MIEKVPYKGVDIIVTSPNYTSDYQCPTCLIRYSHIQSAKSCVDMHIEQLTCEHTFDYYLEPSDSEYNCTTSIVQTCRVCYQKNEASFKDLKDKDLETVFKLINEK